MAITTYAELQAAAANWLVRGDLAQRIPEFIALAEAQMNRALRVRGMERRDLATVTDAYSAVPAGFLEAKSITLSQDGETWALDPKPAEALDEAGAASGRPRFYGVTGGELRFHPAPDSAYQATLTYYTRIPALSDANPTNWLLAAAPDAYLYGTLLQAAPYLRDEAAAQAYSAGFESALGALQAAERTKAGKLRTSLPADGRAGWRIAAD